MLWPCTAWACLQNASKGGAVIAAFFASVESREAAVLDLFEDKDGDQLRHKHRTWHGLLSSTANL